MTVAGDDLWGQNIPNIVLSQKLRINEYSNNWHFNLIMWTNWV